MTSEWKEHEAKNYRDLTLTEYQSLFNDIEIRKNKMNDKELSLLSAFEFLECRKLENKPIHLVRFTKKTQNRQDFASVLPNTQPGTDMTYK